MLGEVDCSEDGMSADVMEEVEDMVEDDEEEDNEEYFTEDDDEYSEEHEEEDDVLEFEEDDTKMFSDRASYFAANPSATSFVGFTEDQNNKTRAMISNKADGRYRDMNDD